jgi:cysteinyl-tRNA synthetase
MKFIKLFILAAHIFWSGYIYADSPPASFAYVLQAEELTSSRAETIEQLTQCNREWIILDAVYSIGSPWAPGELDTIRKGQPGRKIVAYISIGEAEDYRPYWKNEWGRNGKLTAAAPAWLGAENPDWEGNYRVKYWDLEWQSIMLAAVDDTMNRGFDGVYLDIVDGFEAFEQDGNEFIDERLNPETNQSYRRDMVDWVKTIAARARLHNPGVLVIPQNGSQLTAYADFVDAISSMGIEDLFTHDNRIQPDSHTEFILGYLEKMEEAGKPVLLIEYPRWARRKELSRELSEQNGFVWLQTDRALKTLGVSGR